MVYRSSWRGNDFGCRTAKYSGGLSSSRVSQAEKEIDVYGSPDAQLRVSHARSITVWLIQSLGGHVSLIHIRTPWISDLKDTSTTCHGDCLMLCTYNARTVSTHANLQALPEAAGRINYHVIARNKVQEDGRGAAE
ncbi:unnamed protein product [Strongylus vulgaris]|uniref:Uncharacterized protein n=1 Tax=Strongylus vulgaris TaxID=40348 RepID=A0A3P7IQQ2_STRVU|nr:unnamed protein product [Strongylus vulgaris]